jgi:two-component system, chemotaxis family, sensor kinase CheA
LSDLTDQLQHILAGVEELRKAANDGPTTRKLLDSIFRNVHSLKATASANGLNDLAAAAHELENILHSLRTGTNPFDEDRIPIGLSLTQTEKHALQQSLAEGAGLFLVQTNFDVADFDQQFQSLKERLNQGGEVISTTPTADSDKINFRILYTRAGALPPELLATPNVTIESVATSTSDNATNREELKARVAELEQFVAELRTTQISSVEDLLDQAVRAGQAAAAATGKNVDFVVRCENVSLDSARCEALSDPLMHLVRNAVDHGIEDRGGTIVIEVVKVSGETRITVADDGRGIAPEQLESIFQPGFSTAANVSEISGRGVGLDVVATRVKELGGLIRVESHPGKGSVFEIVLQN